jgi:hypothetical protein
MKVNNLALSISEICCRFPRVGAFFIALPFNYVLELSIEDTRVCDLVNSVFLLTFHCDRVRWRRLVKTVISIESKIVDMENRIEFQIVR